MPRDAVAGPGQRGGRLCPGTERAAGWAAPPAEVAAPVEVAVPAGAGGQQRQNARRSSVSARAVHGLRASKSRDDTSAERLRREGFYTLPPTTRDTVDPSAEEVEQRERERGTEIERHAHTYVTHVCTYADSAHAFLFAQVVPGSLAAMLRRELLCCVPETLPEPRPSDTAHCDPVRMPARTPLRPCKARARMCSRAAACVADQIKTRGV